MRARSDRPSRNANARSTRHPTPRPLTEAAGEWLPSDARLACQTIITQLQAIEVQIGALTGTSTRVIRSMP